MVPIELGIILSADKKAGGYYIPDLKLPDRGNHKQYFTDLIILQRIPQQIIRENFPCIADIIILTFTGVGYAIIPLVFALAGSPFIETENNNSHLQRLGERFSYFIRHSIMINVHIHNL